MFKWDMIKAILLLIGLIILGYLAAKFGIAFFR